jgi:NADH-quinone oxidoreductase subunit I
MSEYDRQNMVYEKEHLLVDGEGKVPGYDFYKVAGVAVPGKGKAGGGNEEPPVDLRSLLP